MTVPRPRPALVVWLVVLLALAVSGWVLLPFPRRAPGWEEILWAVGFGAGFATVGAILVDRRPREPVSRVTLGLGLVAVGAVALRAVAVWLAAQPGDVPPIAAVMAGVSTWLQSVAFIGAGSFLIVRFPAGREPGRLATVVDALVGIIVVGGLLALLRPGEVVQDWLPQATNPLGVEALGPLVERADSIGLVLYLASVVLAFIVLARRYRRASPTVRAQIRWFGMGCGLPVAILTLSLVWSDVGWLWSAWFVATIFVPVTIGIAILRYHLFDIDRIIGRGVAYGLVTAVLAALFIVSNLALQALLAGATGASTLVVAVSTLLVAALFQPIRRAIQTPIDRRFNRRALDAERVVGEFTQRTRDEVDIERLRRAVVGTASEAVAPAGASLWLRDTRAGT
ncbi:MAG TPA: hypothetical protein VFL03_13765 [Candidatus Limnocylindrales bacterium]|jgi:hypothetical protein|nr:hypothetical protein [Candidatus Limnocylindrales bacterium]